MLKILKSKEGMAFPMIMIIATVGIILFGTMAELAFRNYMMVRTNNTRSNAYYIADYGAEKVIKNVETIVESAKIYANEMMRKPGSGTESEYDQLVEMDLSQQQFEKEYRLRYEKFFVEFMKGTNGFAVAETKNPDAAEDNFVSLGNANLPQAKYKATITASADFNHLAASPDYTLHIKVEGKHGTDRYNRKVDVDLGVDPWGYNKSKPDTSNIIANENVVYSSPQWSSALASSGNIVVQGAGKVTVNGDIYVNGYDPPDDASTGQGQEGRTYGGLVVGGNTSKGVLIVQGNVFSNNYVHTKYPGSEIYVRPRNANGINYAQANYDSDVDQIYWNTTVDSRYSEQAANLNNKFDALGNPNPITKYNNPLGLSPGILGQVESRMTSMGKANTGVVVYTDDPDDTYIKYLKNTYYIQKKYGGFIYANNVQIEKNDNSVSSTTPQKIDVAGSAIIFDNLQADNVGDLIIHNNFYGFMGGQSYYNQSSSIATNHPEGIIDIGKRIYTAGVAYVTAYYDGLPAGSPDGIPEKTLINGKMAYKPYMTGDSATIFRNFYSYRAQLFGGEMRSYPPFSFEFLNDSITEAIKHVFWYNSTNNIGPTIMEGGTVLDRAMIKLNDSIYDDSAVKLAANDMGYSEGVLIGDTGFGRTFMGLINSDTSFMGAGPEEALAQSKRATNSVSRSAFMLNIQNKYSILNAVKSLKSEKGHVVTLNELIDTSEYTSPLIFTTSPSNYSANFIVATGEILVKAVNSNKLQITADGITYDFGKENGVLTYKGIIVSTDGKIRIEGDEDIRIMGAVISGVSTNSDGIVFSGNGDKEIQYKKQILLNIFKLPTDKAQKVKRMLTRYRGSVEMFKKMYGDSLFTDFKELVDQIQSDPDKNIQADPTTGKSALEKTFEYIADKYEIIDPDPDISDRSVLYKDVLGELMGEGSRNYKILKWNATN